MTTRNAILSITVITALLGVACNDKDARKADTTTTTNAATPVATDNTKAADNTKLNERDRHETVTPTDQSNSKEDIEVSAAIRKSMMSDSTLSFDAKNAKVITVGTKVTLRGPVKSAEERAAIERIAKGTKGVTEVDNQLEIKKDK